MAKIECPQCGHRFKRISKIKSIGVRSKPNGRKFDYEITMPENIPEDGRIATASNDATLISLFSLYAGVAGAGVASAFLPDHLPPDVVTQITAHVGVITMGVAGAIGYGALCAESEQRLKRVLPWFLKQKEGWAMGKDETISGNVELTMDHRYRDGNTESGRTIQYFGALPVDVERFSEWAAAVLGTDKLPGQSLAISHWTGSDGLFSRKEYEALLALLRKAEAAINQPGKGNILTGGGRRALRQHLKAHSPTSLLECA